jgi:hypothetical protein
MQQRSGGVNAGGSTPHGVVPASGHAALPPRPRTSPRSSPSHRAALSPSPATSPQRAAREGLPADIKLEERGGGKTQQMSVSLKRVLDDAASDQQHAPIRPPRSPKRVRSPLPPRHPSRSKPQHDWRVAMHLDALQDRQLMRVVRDVEARCRALAAFESAEIRRAMALGLARV